MPKAPFSKGDLVWYKDRYGVFCPGKVSSMSRWLPRTFETTRQLSLHPSAVRGEFHSSRNGVHPHLAGSQHRT